MKGLNDWAAVVHRQAKDMGRYDEEPPVSELLMNIHGEVSELWEAYRKGILAEKCVKCDLTNEEEEVADILLRTLDYAGSRGLDVEKIVAMKLTHNRMRGHRHGGKKA